MEKQQFSLKEFYFKMMSENGVCTIVAIIVMAQCVKSGYIKKNCHHIMLYMYDNSMADIR